VQIKGLAPFGARKRLQMGKFWVSEKLFLSQTTGLNALIFGMKQPWEKETQVCTNTIPGVIMTPPQQDLVLYRYIYMYIANSLEKSSSNEPLARMLFKLAWNILGTRRFKFVQMIFLKVLF